MMRFNKGTIARKFRTVSSLTSPSASLRERKIYFVKLTRDCHSLATESEYVRGKLADHANDLLRLGTDGFRIDAAKRKSVLGSFEAELTDASLLDIPVDDLRAIFGRLSRAPSYVTQEV